LIKQLLYGFLILLLTFSHYLLRTSPGNLRNCLHSPTYIRTPFGLLHLHLSPLTLFPPPPFLSVSRTFFRTISCTFSPLALREILFWPFLLEKLFSFENFLSSSCTHGGHKNLAQTASRCLLRSAFSWGRSDKQFSTN